jgi:pseudouridine-5'-monophosphatase
VIAGLPRPATHVIFDMDGVLLDTERLYTDATQQIVGRWGHVYDWSIKGHMIGRPAIDSARYLVATLALPITPEEYLAEREAIFQTLMPTAEPMAGARALTDALAARGVPTAVATSSSRAMFALKTTRHHAWFDRFEVIVLGDDAAVTRGKPAPDIFLVAAERLGARPETCVAARAARMQVIAVPDPGMDRSRFNDADLIFDSLVDVRLANRMST